MVTFENKSTNLNKISEALENNLNIIPSDSRLKTINDKIADSRYRIKDLSTITDTVLCSRLITIDGKLFLLPSNDDAGTIQVRDYQNDVLLKTISDGANVITTGACYDDQFIYISKVIETISDKKYRDVYVRKYNRCTLDLVSESPILYTGVSGVSLTNYSNIFSMLENGEFLYLACVQDMQSLAIYHHIRKIRKSDFSLVTSREWATPLYITKHTNGLFVSGRNSLSSDPKYMRIDFLDWELNVIQTFPQTTLTISNFRYSVYKDDYLYAGNDSGVLVKYQISTNTIIAEVQTSEPALIRSVILINNDFLLLQTNTSKIMLYDLNLNFIKMWNFYNTTTTDGNIVGDNNNTIWTQSASQPTIIYKKQFIDMTEGIV